MLSLTDLPVNFLSSAVLPVVLSSAVVFLARNWISERLRQSIQHEYAQKLEAYKVSLKAEHDVALERLRTDAAQARAIQDVATGSFLVSHREGQQRRLRAIEDLWNATLRIRESIPNIVVLQDIFTREEYPQIFTREKYAGSLEELTLEGIGTALYGASRDVESSRPFVGDYLWSLFFAYRAIMGRFWVLLVFGREDASNIVHWSMDSGVRQLLEAVLTSSELDEIYKARLGGVESTRKTIEAKILNAANRIISGEEASKLGLDQAKKIAAAASAVELRSRQA